MIYIWAVTVKLGSWYAIKRDSSQHSITRRRSEYCLVFSSTSRKPCFLKNSSALRSAKATIEPYSSLRCWIMRFPRPFYWQSDLMDSRNSSAMPVPPYSFLCSRTTEPPMTLPLSVSWRTKDVQAGFFILPTMRCTAILGNSSWMITDRSINFLSITLWNHLILVEFKIILLTLSCSWVHSEFCKWLLFLRYYSVWMASLPCWTSLIMSWSSYCHQSMGSTLSCHWVSSQ